MSTTGFDDQFTDFVPEGRPFTGNAPGMLQDDDRGLSGWLSQRGPARQLADEAAAAISAVATGADHLALLREAATLFRSYEQSHRARGPEHLQKAERNAEIAGRIEAALIAQPAQAPAGEPVAAQHRFRHPQKNMPDWSPWQPASIADRPAWQVDSLGFEVEYRLLYTTPPAAARVPEPSDGRASAYAALQASHTKLADRVRFLEASARGESWVWQGDGEDHPESMAASLPVLIRADQLRELTAAARVPAGEPVKGQSARAAKRDQLAADASARIDALSARERSTLKLQGDGAPPAAARVPLTPAELLRMAERHWYVKERVRNFDSVGFAHDVLKAASQEGTPPAAARVQVTPVQVDMSRCNCRTSVDDCDFPNCAATRQEGGAA